MEGKLTPDLSPVSPSTPSVDSSICMNNTDKSISCKQPCQMREIKNIFHCIKILILQLYFDAVKQTPNID